MARSFPARLTLNEWDESIAAMQPKSKAYNQDDATGFIRLNALRLKVAAKAQRKK